MTAQAIPWGTCPSCGRGYHLTANGVVRVHAKDRRNAITCPGSGLPPKGGAR